MPVAQGERKINVLLVDDRPDGLITLSAVLASPGYNLVTASSGQEALARLFDSDFAVILLDVQMPGMDGFETASVIKQFERSRHIPIIFVTAINKDPRYVLSGYEAGAVDYITKPFDPFVLRSKVAVFADLYRKQRQLEEQAEQLRRSESRNRVLVEQARDIITTLLPNLTIVSLNPAFERVTGWRAEEWIGRSIQELVHPDDVTLVGEKLGLPSETEPLLFEFRIRTRFGTVVLVEGAARPFDGNDGVNNILAVVRDISARRQVELERKRRDELERSNRDLQHFAHICSHDLQEPLRQVATFAQILGKRYKGKLDADADEFIGHIVQGAVWMSQLVQEILSYSRLQQTEPSYETVSGQELVERAIGNIAISLEENRCQVIWERLPEVYGNRSQLVQLFQNLISNSLKFRSAVEPKIRITAEKRDEEWLFAVSDNGIGFEMEYAERIFHVFQRLHRREEYPGTGMGLAICKRIIERHSGRIWAQSRLGTGSTFFFTLPAYFPASEANKSGCASSTVRSVGLASSAAARL